MNVLLIDDDDICNFINKTTLEHLGIISSIHSALNGQQALNLFNEYYQGLKILPDIILLDLDMPFMDGFGFLEAFKRLKLPRQEQVKIIILTSSNNPEDKKRAQSFGIAGYLNKPLKEKEILELIMA